MSPTPGEPGSEPEVPNDAVEPLPLDAEVIISAESITEIDKSLTSILAGTDVMQEQEIGEAKVKGKRGRPAQQSIPPITWSIRGVTRDTRSLLEQAARRVGKTLGQYLNEDVRVCIEQQLQLTPAPASMATLQKQIHYLRQMVENLAAMIRASHPDPAPNEGRPPGT